MLTVKQIADSAGVSKTTVTKYLRAYEAEHEKEAAELITKNEQNIIQISEELAEQLIKAILNQKENRQPTTNPLQTANPVNAELQTVSANACTNPLQTTANIPQTDTNQLQTVSANPPQTANPDTIAVLNEIIDTLKAQLKQQEQRAEQDRQDFKEQINRAESDKADLKEQLTAKDKQIEQLNSSLSQITTTLSQQQALHMEHMKQLPAPEQEETKPQKKSLFSLFRRK